jgi:hypothetical protein
MPFTASLSHDLSNTFTQSNAFSHTSAGKFPGSQVPNNSPNRRLRIIIGTSAGVGVLVVASIIGAYFVLRKRFRDDDEEEEEEAQSDDEDFGVGRLRNVLITQENPLFETANVFAESGNDDEMQDSHGEL